MTCSFSKIGIIKIIIGMLKTIIIKLPIAKFFLFNRFIEPEIDEIQVIMGEPIKKLKSTNSKFCIFIFKSSQAMGIIKKNGNCKKIQMVKILDM